MIFCAANNNGALTVALIILALIAIPVIFSFVFDKAEKKAEKGNGGCLGFVLIAVVVGWIIMCVGQCKQCSEGKFSKEWEPRHTQNIEFNQNNVNLCNFYASNYCMNV